MTRAEAASLTDTVLEIVISATAIGLARSWERGEPGSLTALYDLAVLAAERSIRVGSPFVPVHRGQLRLFDA